MSVIPMVLMLLFPASSNTEQGTMISVRLDGCLTESSFEASFVLWTDSYEPFGSLRMTARVLLFF